MSPFSEISKWFDLLKAKPNEALINYEKKREDSPEIDEDDIEPDNYEPDEDVGDPNRER